MTVTAGQLAALVEGQIEGDGELAIHEARPLHEAGAGHITFLDNDKHLARLHASAAAAAVVGAQTPAGGKTVIRVPEPAAAFLAIAQQLHGRPEPAPSGIDPRAAVHDTAGIGPDATIAAFAVVGAGTKIGARCRLHSGVSIGADCRLGDDVVLHPHVVLYDGTILGDRVVVHANAVIGADGFGYRFQEGRHVKVPQLGYAEIGDDVEVGAGTTIDRGAFGSTRIGRGTKIDNLVQVAHNCQIGEHVILVSQVGIAGSCTVGDYAVLAGQAGIADHLDIGARAVIGAKAGVMRDVPAGARMFGYPARPDREELRIHSVLEKLPELHRILQRLKKQLGLTDDLRKRAS